MENALMSPRGPAYAAVFKQECSTPTDAKVHLTGWHGLIIPEPWAVADNLLCIEVGVLTPYYSSIDPSEAVMQIQVNAVHERDGCYVDNVQAFVRDLDSLWRTGNGRAVLRGYTGKFELELVAASVSKRRPGFLVSGRISQPMKQRGEWKEQVDWALESRGDNFALETRFAVLVDQHSLREGHAVLSEFASAYDTTSA